MIFRWWVAKLEWAVVLVFLWSAGSVATQPGYENHRNWFELTAGNRVYTVELEAKPEPPPPIVGRPGQDMSSQSGKPAPGRRGGKEWRDPVTGMAFVKVPGGCYRMGSKGKNCCDEKPVHEVCLDGFWMGKYEVTVGQWKAVMGSNPSDLTNCGTNCPVEQVSWDDAQEFIRKLNRRGSHELRLPTEAEWEYACRSGGESQFRWYKDDAGWKTHRVGTKSPNGLGVYDMNGNVWEWVQDWYDKNAYSRHSRKNPVNNTGVTDRVARGGGWGHFGSRTRCADRNFFNPGRGFDYLGFRLLRMVSSG